MYPHWGCTPIYRPLSYLIPLDPWTDRQREKKKENLVKDKLYTAQSIYTWILHQIFMFSNKVKLAAGQNNFFSLLTIPSPPTVGTD